MKCLSKARTREGNLSEDTENGRLIFVKGERTDELLSDKKNKNEWFTAIRLGEIKRNVSAVEEDLKVVMLEAKSGDGRRQQEEPERDVIVDICRWLGQNENRRR